MIDFHPLLVNGVMPGIVCVLVFFIVGWLPSIVRRMPVQRTWLAVVSSSCVALFVVLVDGKFLQEPVIGITEMIIGWAAGMNFLWVISNVLEKAISSITVKKGNFEITVEKPTPENHPSRRKDDNTFLGGSI